MQFILLQRGSRYFFHAHSASPRGRWWLLCSCDTKEILTQGQGVVGRGLLSGYRWKEKTFLYTACNQCEQAVLASVWVPKKLLWLVWCKWSQYFHWNEDGSEDTFLPQNVTEITTSTTLKLNFLTKIFKINILLPKSLVLFILKQHFSNRFLQNINLMECPGIKDFMWQNWGNTECYVPLDSQC